METALLLPLLLALILNVVNFGYFFLVALHLSSAPRSGVSYSIMGSTTPGGSSTGLPTWGPYDSGTCTPGGSDKTVACLTYLDITGSLSNASSASVQVCSQSIGVNGSGSSLKADCLPSTTYTPKPDPEAPSFVLQRVDVAYTFTPLIPGAVFNIATAAVCPNSPCTFHRQVSMRAMN